MLRKALCVTIEARPGKESEVEQLLSDGLELVQAEPETKAWFAVKIDKSTFGIFDAFPDEAGRETHLTGRIGEILKEKGAGLFAREPKIDKLDIIAEKLPGDLPWEARREQASQSASRSWIETHGRGRI